MASFPEVFLGAPGMVTPLGSGADINIRAVSAGLSGITLQTDAFGLGQDVYCGTIKDDLISSKGQGTRLDRMIYEVCQQTEAGLKEGRLPEETHVIICTTKGNIDLIGPEAPNGAELWQLGAQLQRNLGRKLRCHTISHACISGINGIMQGALLLQTGRAKHVLVIGADACTRFTLSGFLCLQAVSKGICSPYDSQRDGINLGEAAASLFMTVNPGLINGHRARYLGGGAANDANHISGPSRTAEGLVRSIDRAFTEAGLGPSDISLISAHGTATIFNDEMESIAFSRTALSAVPTHSLKPFFGHTLGAAGVVETIVSLGAFQQGICLGNIRLNELGVSEPMNLPQANTPVSGNFMLKTGSGFGGCNAAMIIDRQQGE
jgi:3-oxoacyl-[acyl-carrier-protein] synthase-1